MTQPSYSLSFDEPDEVLPLNYPLDMQQLQIWYVVIYIYIYIYMYIQLTNKNFQGDFTSVTRFIMVLIMIKFE
jgi:hypothetical protein